MKYLPHFLLATVTAISLASCAAPGGGGGATAESQMGPHSAQKFALVTRVGARTLDPNSVHTMAVVLTVEQTMKDGQQDVVAKSSVRKDGPHGGLQSAQGLQVRIVEPGPTMESKPRTTSEAGEVNVSKSFSAPGGKYKTVTAEATLQNPDFSEGHVTLTIPGDK